MRVLFLAYPHIGLNRGGLQIRIEKTALALKALGVEVIFYNAWKNQIPDVDICHIFGFLGSMRFHVKQATAEGKGVVISPVLNVFSSSRYSLRLQLALSNVIPGLLQNWQYTHGMLRQSDHVIALNVEEYQVLTGCFGIEPNRCQIIPNGLDPRIGKCDKYLARERLGFDDYVMEVGSICQRKNQLTLIKAMRGLPYRLVLVGPVTEPAYYQKCLTTAGENVVFLGEVANEDPLLPSLYAAAKLFVLPSFSEVRPSALYEAGLAGCRLIASHNYPVEGKLYAAVRRIHPNHCGRLTQTIREEMEQDRNIQAAEIVGAMPSWNRVAEMIYATYKDICMRSGLGHK